MVNDIDVANLYHAEKSLFGIAASSSAELQAVADQRVIYNVRPGITGLGSIVFRDEERLLSQPGIDPVVFYTEKIAPYKGELEIWYQQHASLWLDIKLIFLTAWVIVKPESELPFRWLKGLPERPEYLK